MKRVYKITGLLLIVAIAATGCRFAHKRMQENRLKKQEKALELRRGQRMGRQGQFAFRGPGAGIPDNNFGGPGGMRGRGMMNGMGRGAGMRGGMGRGNGMMNGMRGGMGPMMQGQEGPGMLLRRIPDLTEKQRKEILDLQQKQMQEMDKLREEMSSKMQNLREANRTKIMSLLTDEQKKQLESGRPANRPMQPSAPAGPPAIKQ